MPRTQTDRRSARSGLPESPETRTAVAVSSNRQDGSRKAMEVGGSTGRLDEVVARILGSLSDLVRIRFNGASLGADYAFEEDDFSTQLLLPVEGTGVNLRVKIPLPLAAIESGQGSPTERKSSSWSEYCALEDFWSLFGDGGEEGCSAFEPIAYLDEWAAIVTIDVTGNNLSSLLSRRSSWQEARAGMSFSHAGRWLRRFHQRYHLAERTLAQTQLPVELDRFNGDARRLQSASLRRATDEAKRLSTSIADTRVRIVRLHGDFHGDTILVGDNLRIYAFDPCDRPPYRALQDVATALLQPSLKLVEDSRTPLSARRLKLFQEEFLQAYLGGAMTMEMNALPLVACMQVLASWRDLEMSSAGRGVRRIVGTARKRRRRTYLRGLFDQWLALAETR